MKRIIVCLLCTLSATLWAFDELIYVDDAKLAAVKSEVQAIHPYFFTAYMSLIDAADDELGKAINPVTNKTQTPPSGDKHDYLSLAPYWWPNPDTPDGLPWIRKDGQVNPETRGDHTDQVRSSEMFKSIETLALAYYFTGSKPYANKAYQHIYAWFINEATKMNPNINYGQAVPGSVDGRAAGIIEFVGVGSLITALQILDRDSIIPYQESLTMKQWISDMVTWLTTHEYALKENDANNNHGNWYDYQVLGMYMYIGDTAKALAKAESIKTRRIAVQLTSDGAQPEELGRTKSVNYSTMNLWAMTRLSVMAKKLGVDLWNYESNQGASIRRAYEFLVPYVMKTKTWNWEQIIGGGAEQSLENLVVPLFAKASGIFQETLLPTSKSGANELSYIDKLCFPPLEMLQETPENKLRITFSKPSHDTLVYVGAMPTSYHFNVDMASGSLADLSLWMAIDGIALRSANGKRQVWQGTDKIEHEALALLTKGTHELKVVAQLADGSIAEDYLNLTVDARSMPFTGSALPIPGVIEVEDYDVGGPEVSYHDSDNENYYGKYRNDGVDLLQSGTTVYVSQIEEGEWLNYTVDVSEAGWYDVKFNYSATESCSVSLQWEEADTVLFEPFLLSSGTSSATQARIWLAEGQRILRLNFEKTATFHLDKMTISVATSAALKHQVMEDFRLYPNPTAGELFFDSDVDWLVFSITGQFLMQGYGRMIDLEDASCGLYVVHCPMGIKKVLKY